MQIIPRLPGSSGLVGRARGYVGRFLGQVFDIRPDPIKNILPPEYQFAHAYCFDLHDRLLSLIANGEDTGAFNFKLVFKSPAQATEFQELATEDILDWMGENGFEKELGEALRKRVFPALLKDLYHFLYEALICSQKGKLTVTYALLRKPLKDDLYYLELLLADPQKMLGTLFYGDPMELNLNPQKVKATDTTRQAIGLTEHPTMFDAEFLSELRYEKGCEYGFEQPCNRALHVVTHYPKVQTASRSLNFIFEGPDTMCNRIRELC